MVKDAIISPCGTWRYSLTREWHDNKLNMLGVIMLNPSNADADKGDPTVAATVGFAKKWGYSGIRIGNLFAFRSPSPAALAVAFTEGKAVGPENDLHLRNIIQMSSAVAVGWGSWGRVYIERARQVDHLIRHLDRVPRCIGITANRHPKHFLLRFHTAQQKAAAKLEFWTCP